MQVLFKTFLLGSRRHGLLSCCRVFPIGLASVAILISAAGCSQLVTFSGTGELFPLKDDRAAPAQVDRPAVRPIPAEEAPENRIAENTPAPATPQLVRSEPPQLSELVFNELPANDIYARPNVSAQTDGNNQPVLNSQPVLNNQSPVEQVAEGRLILVEKQPLESEVSPVANDVKGEVIDSGDVAGRDATEPFVSEPVERILLVPSAVGKPDVATSAGTESDRLRPILSTTSKPLVPMDQAETKSVPLPPTVIELATQIPQDLTDQASSTLSPVSTVLIPLPNLTGLEAEKVGVVEEPQRASPDQSVDPNVPAAPENFVTVGGEFQPLPLAMPLPLSVFNQGNRAGADAAGPQVDTPLDAPAAEGEVALVSAETEGEISTPRSTDMPQPGDSFVPPVKEVEPPSQFPASVPAIHSGRQFLPAVDLSATGSGDDSATIGIEKKNFGSVDFTDSNLPMPASGTAPWESEPEFEQVSYDVGEKVNVAAPMTQSEIPPVGVEALQELNAITWQSRLEQAVKLIENQLADQSVDSQTRTNLEINLRLLKVLNRQMVGLSDQHQQFTGSELQFWQHQLEAITSMVAPAEHLSQVADVSSDLVRRQTAHQTLAHLRRAVAQLESLANLKVIGGAFCTEVSGYGQYRVFPKNEFSAGQQLLIYCEIENYASVQPTTLDNGQVQPMFETRLDASYVIYDEAGQAVQQAEFQTLSDVARKRRRDFYMHLPITIGDLPSGSYKLHVLIEDLHGNKAASLAPALSFQIVN